MEIFFTGVHHPYEAHRVSPAFISINTLRNRRSFFPVHEWVMDSGAFEALRRHAEHRMTVYGYAAQIMYWKRCGKLLAAVTQDYMCEPMMLSRTGLTVKDHQRKTIERYDALLRCDTGVYIMPVLQGYQPEEYADHVRDYGDRLALGAWVGVGSVCKRNGSPRQVLEVLRAIHEVRPDLKLHGFGLKITSLRDPEIRAELYSSDSMAWSFGARKERSNANDYSHAIRFKNDIDLLIAS